MGSGLRTSTCGQMMRPTGSGRSSTRQTGIFMRKINRWMPVGRSDTASSHQRAMVPPFPSRAGSGHPDGHPLNVSVAARSADKEGDRANAWAMGCPRRQTSDRLAASSSKVTTQTPAARRRCKATAASAALEALQSPARDTGAAVPGGRYTLLTLTAGWNAKCGRPATASAATLSPQRFLRPELTGVRNPRCRARNSIRSSHPNIANTQDSVKTASPDHRETSVDGQPADGP